MFPEDEQSDTAEPRLARTLGEMYRSPAVGPEVDQRIVHSAFAAFERRRRTRLLVRWGSGVAAAAAAAVLLMSIVPFGSAPEQLGSSIVRMPGPATRPTILDALALARRIEQTPADLRPVEWDLNHDGKVDQLDPRIIAMEVVKLPEDVR